MISLEIIRFRGLEDDEDVDDTEAKELRVADKLCPLISVELGG
jgi:hypothetical protein